MTRRCPRCSAVLPATAHFCRRCGAAQAEVAPRSVAVPPPIRAASPQAARQPPPIPRRVRSRFIGLLVFLGLLGAGLVFLDQQQQQPPAPAPVSVPATPVNPLVINSYPQQMQRLAPIYPQQMQWPVPMYPRQLQRPVPMYPAPVHPVPPRVVVPYSGWPVVVPNYQGRDDPQSDDRGHESGH